MHNHEIYPGGFACAARRSTFPVDQRRHESNLLGQIGGRSGPYDKQRKLFEGEEEVYLVQWWAVERASPRAWRLEGNNEPTTLMLKADE